MRYLLALLLVLPTSASFASEIPKLAFERSGDVWVANIDGTGQKIIAKGQLPDIARDGTKLAFNTVQLAGAAIPAVGWSATWNRHTVLSR